MTPMAEYYGGSDGTDNKDSREFVVEVLGATLEVFGIPDPEDREIRKPHLEEDSQTHSLRIAYTVGSNVYDYLEEEGIGPFQPTPQQRQALALKIAELKEIHNIEMERLELVEWADTAFELIGEEDLERDPVPEEDLPEEIALFSSKLYLNSFDMSPLFGDLLPGCEIIVVEGSDAPVGLELDTDQDVAVEVKEKLARILKERLISKMGSNKSFAYSTVWVRSGKPNVYSYDGNGQEIFEKKL